jgi:hypothetical protein
VGAIGMVIIDNRDLCNEKFDQICMPGADKLKNERYEL